MINNNISFGKKIPLTTCQIQDKKTGNFVPATLFEYDCKDEDDILEIVFTGKQWYISGNGEGILFCDPDDFVKR